MIDLNELEAALNKSDAVTVEITAEGVLTITLTQKSKDQPESPWHPDEWPGIQYDEPVTFHGHTKVAHTKALTAWLDLALNQPKTVSIDINKEQADALRHTGAVTISPTYPRMSTRQELRDLLRPNKKKWWRRG